MGLETALLVATVASAGSSVVSGIQQNNEAKKQAKLTLQKADAEANEELAQGQRYRNKQAVAYLKSGVAIDQGSPLLAMQATLDTAATNAKNIRDTGWAQAKSLKKQGRNALIGGIMGGVGAVAGGATQYKTLAAQGYVGAGKIPAYNTATGSAGAAATRSGNTVINWD